MIKANKFEIAIILLLFSLAFSVKTANAQDYINIDVDTTWTKETPNLIFDKLIVIKNGATLTIEKGTTVVFQENLSQSFNLIGIEVINGKLIANGTEEEKIIFTSPDDGFSFSFEDNIQTSFMRYTEIVNGGYMPTAEGNGGDLVPHFPAIAINGGKIHIENSKFFNSRFTEINISDTWAQDADGNYIEDENGDIVENKARVEVVDSNFSYPDMAVDSQLNCWIYDDNTGQDYIDQDCVKRVHLKNNWYGNPAGPTIINNTIEDVNIVYNGYIVSGFAWVDSWRNSSEIIDASEQSCAENCNSNVLFLPGIKASKLYKNDSGDEDQLWPPNYFGNDIEELMLDKNGESIENVYTKDVLEETTSGNIYKSFKEDLESLKTGGKINDFNFFAYDWRQDAEDTAKNGTPYENIVKSLTAEIQTLAENSKNKKVTIVAHSNGGLVAKVAMLELEKMGLTGKVDKIIFVATPQMGAPITTLSMLYGHGEQLVWGSLMSQEEARKLAENMPSAYGLLPTKIYFDRMENPFITFSSENTRYKIFKDAYGESIDNLGEFKNFLLGIDDERTKPEESDIESENILNQKLLEETIETHQNLDNWTPPSNVQVIEIAGWGLDTISGVNYAEKEKTKCYAIPGSKIPSCIGMNEYEPIYDPKFTVDGDKVVTAPSALMFQGGENIKRYWVDLYGYNDDNPDREHKDILEADSTRQFISDIITNDSNASLPEYIKTSRPDDYDNASARLRMSLYSPLDIHLYDDQGNHTGPKTITDENGNEQIIIEENIPNSYYYQFGDRKYAGVPEGKYIRMEMDGYALGTYTLKLEEIKTTATGEETISQAVFENFPTTADTTVKMDIPETGIAEILSIKADIDSNGENDYAVDSVPDGTVEFPDMIAPETKIELSGAKGTNDWYVGDVKAILTAEDNEGGSGLDAISYSLNGGASWQNYSEPADISSEGIINLQYFATDKKGNKEETKTETVKIDKTAPEAKLIFDQATQELAVFGADNLSPNVSVEIEEQEIKQKPEIKKGIFSWISDIIKKGEKKKNVITTLSDEAGHKTEIVFEKKENNNHRVDISPQSVSYDGIKTEFSKSLLQYKWFLDWRKKKYLLFGSHIAVDSEHLESHYFPRRNETWIMEKPQELDDANNDDAAERRPVWKKISGMIVPYLQTSQGKIEIKY